MIESCMTCRWVGCRDYGKALGSCFKYIPEIRTDEDEKTETGADLKAEGKE